MSPEQACEVLKISRNGLYRNENQKRASDRDGVVVEKLKKVRLFHLFWGFRPIRALLNHGEGLKVHLKLLYRLMRGNGLVVEQVRHKDLSSAQRRETILCG